MSARQNKSSTTSTVSPSVKITRKIAARLEDRRPGKKNSSANTSPHSGSKEDRRRTKKPGAGIRLHRRPGNKMEVLTDEELAKQEKELAMKETKTKGELMNDIIRIVQYIIENHGKNVNTVMEHYKDKTMLSQVAQKCMSTCLSGWTETEEDRKSVV